LFELVKLVEEHLPLNCATEPSWLRLRVFVAFAELELVLVVPVLALVFLAPSVLGLSSVAALTEFEIMGLPFSDSADWNKDASLPSC
jgi:hypothetical protein